MTLLILNFQLEISDRIKIRDELKDKKIQYVFFFCLLVYHYLLYDY